MPVNQTKSWQASTHYTSVHIAGFSYYEGLLLLSHLEVGMKLDLFLEKDNPYDPNAVALYLKDKKLGYLPKEKNTLISQLLRFGHTNVIEAFVQQVDKEAHPEMQVKVALRFIDKTK